MGHLLGIVWAGRARDRTQTQRPLLSQPGLPQTQVTVLMPSVLPPSSPVHYAVLQHRGNLPPVSPTDMKGPGEALATPPYTTPCPTPYTHCPFPMPHPGVPKKSGLKDSNTM